MTTVFNVPEVSCEHCKSAIESSLLQVQGVSGADVAIESRSVTIERARSCAGRPGGSRPVSRLFGRPEGLRMMRRAQERPRDTHRTRIRFR